MVSLHAFADGTPRFEQIATFTKSMRNPARGGLCVTSSGQYYGLATAGGDSDLGGIYLYTSSDRVITPLVSFTGSTFYGTGSAYGSTASGTLVFSGGSLWGTTAKGGQNDGGTIFRYNPITRVFVTVKHFNAPFAYPYIASPKAGLVKDANGKLWGSTSAIRPYPRSYGTIFKLDPFDNSVTTVAALTGAQGSMLGQEVSGEMLLSGGLLWGVTNLGGATNEGTVFKIDPATGTFTTVVDFTGTTVLTGGRFPMGPLCDSGTGFLWGLCSPPAGNTAAARVFNINKSTGAITFVGTVPSSNEVSKVLDGLVTDGSGNFFGLGVSSVSNIEAKISTGAPFSVSAAGAVRIGAPFTSSGPMGSMPVGFGKTTDSKFFVTTSDPERMGPGAIHSLNTSLSNPSTSQFASFSKSSAAEAQTGFQPAGGVIGDDTGKLWGMNRGGGAHDEGTVFAISSATKTLSADSLNVSSSAVGSTPVGELLKDSNGSFFGVTKYGGTNTLLANRGQGSVFTMAKMTQGPMVEMKDPTNLAGLTAANAHPVAGLTLAPDGRFWGTSQNGVFLMKSGGDQIPIATFTGVSGGTPGSKPSTALTSDGTTYMWGCTEAGGAADKGTVFRINASTWQFKSVIQFTGPSGAAPGARPMGQLVSDGHGFLWGTTAAGGRFDAGTIFRIDTTSMTLSLVYEFAGDSDGSSPEAGLVDDGRGRLWGSTRLGGRFGFGLIFTVDPTQIQQRPTHQFEFTSGLDLPASRNYASGSYPAARLYLHSDGNLYGTTSGATLDNGVPKGGGSVFRIRFGGELTLTPQDHHDTLPLTDGVTKVVGPVFDVDDNQTLNYLLKNSSTVSMSDMTAEITGPNAKDFIVKTAPPPLLYIRQSVPLVIEYDPSVVGEGQATLSIGSKSFDTDAIVIALKGTCVKRTIGFTSPTWELSESQPSWPFTLTLAKPLSTAVTIPFTIKYGTATAADFSVTGRSVTIPPNKTSADIVVNLKEDYLIEGTESFTITLGQPTNIHVEAKTNGYSQFVTTTVNITDDDVAPSFPETGGKIVVRLGDPLVIDSGLINPSEMPLTGQWTYNGRPIRGATKPVLNIPVTKMTYAGTFVYTVRTPAGLTVSGPEHSVIIADWTDRVLALPANGRAEFSYEAAGPGLSPSWANAGGGLIVNDQRISGANTTHLVIDHLQLSDSGTYLGQVFDNYSVTALTLHVYDSKPSPPPPALPSTYVGQDYSYQLDLGPPNAAPTAISVQGLPLGLVCDSSTGLVTGQATEPGTFIVVVRMSNSFGSSLPVTAQLTVNPLPRSYVGNFVGWGPGGFISGSRVDATISASGAVTGVITSGKTKQPFITHILIYSDGSAMISLSAPADPQLTLSCAFSGDSITMSYGGEGRMWKNNWSATNPVVPLAGLYTFGLTPNAETSDAITGEGFGSLTLSAPGVAALAGQLADGSSFVSSCPLSSTGEVLLYQPLYVEPGGVHAQLQLTPAAVTGGLNLLTGDGVWAKDPQTAKTRNFQDGFLPLFGNSVMLTAHGSTYLPPLPGGIVLGLPTAGPSGYNALLSFTVPPLVVGSSPDVRLRVSSPGAVTMPAPGSIDNPARAQLAITATNGMFAGSCTFDATVSGAARSTPFKGALISSEGVGVGYFLLPKLPDPSANPPTTAQTSPLVSAIIEFKPNQP